MEKEKINFIPIGRNILIELGQTETKSGIVLPQQSKASDVLQPDEAFKIKIISKEAEEATTLKEGNYIYLTAYATPAVKIEKYGKRYAIIEVNDISGYAPDGFNREEWLKEKEDTKKRLKKSNNVSFTVTQK